MAGIGTPERGTEEKERGIFHRANEEGNGSILLGVGPNCVILAPLLKILHTTAKALFSFQKFCKIFSDFLSHRMFRRMHEVLNINKNKN